MIRCIIILAIALVSLQAQAQNKSEAVFPGPIPQEQEQVEEKNPWHAFGLSVLITGGGQWYNEQYGKGLAQFGIAVAGAGVMLAALEDNTNNIDVDDDDTLGGVGAMMWLGAIVWSLVDAPMSANAINKERRESARFQINPFVGNRTVGAQLTLRF